MSIAKREIGNWTLCCWVYLAHILCGSVLSFWVSLSI